jgi:hypothetical protein
MPTRANLPDAKIRLAKIIIIGVALMAVGFWVRSTLHSPIKAPINESLVPFQGDWRAARSDTGTIAEITICADRRKSPHAITVKNGTAVRNYGLTHYTVWLKDQHLAGRAFWKEHPDYPADSAIVALDIRLEGTNLLFTLAPSTSDEIAPLDVSSATLVCTRQ